MQIGVAGQRRIDPRRAAAVGLMAGDAGAVRRSPCPPSSPPPAAARPSGSGAPAGRLLQIDRDGADIGVAHLRGRIDHDLGHRAAGMAPGRCGRSADIRRCPRRSTISARCARRRRAAARTSRRPSRRHSALAALVGAEHVLRRVAGAAMAGALDQIAAAIPFRAFLLVGLEDAGPEEQQVPGRASRTR